jgi:repressor LexA
MKLHKSLTVRQQAVHEFIVHQIRIRRISPTIREIAREFGIRSPNGVVCHLTALKRAGLIAWNSGQARTIRLLHEPKPTARTVGCVRGGRIRQTKGSGERITLDGIVTPNSAAIVRVEDTSMVRQHVMPGDWVVVKRSRGRLRPFAVIRRLDKEGLAC